MNHSARRINAIAERLGLGTYLEIGVNKGNTFRFIALPEKTGVDPIFQFDPDTLKNPSTRLVTETSDAYFASMPIGTMFDVVFIDGLHTFEQVVRDFSSAILHTHDRSVIILDDTLPSDVFSSLPDRQETYRFRQKLGDARRDWHGDVFKMLFYINDFWPSLNYRTIVSAGNPQTLVWRSKSTRSSPIFNNLETISRLTFFDLHRHIDVLRPATEDDGIAHCVEELQAKA